MNLKAFMEKLRKRTNHAKEQIAGDYYFSHLEILRTVSDVN